MMRPTNMVIQRAGRLLIITFENASVQTQIIASPARLRKWAKEITEATDTEQIRETLTLCVRGVNPPNRLPAILAGATKRKGQ